jgi:hypothetical protein
VNQELQKTRVDLGQARALVAGLQGVAAAARAGATTSAAAATDVCEQPRHRGYAPTRASRSRTGVTHQRIRPVTAIASEHGVAALRELWSCEEQLVTLARWIGGLARLQVLPAGHERPHAAADQPPAAATAVTDEDEPTMAAGADAPA